MTNKVTDWFKNDYAPLMYTQTGLKGEMTRSAI
ncbi:hypothetical protein BH11ARM1_BH11ARM1_04690 [soil metagenome]